MILKMEEKEFNEMIKSAEKFKISFFSTDRQQEKINILANSYLYNLSEPSVTVISEKDPSILRKNILRTINTEEVRGTRVINIIENIHNIDLSALKVE